MKFAAKSVKEENAVSVSGTDTGAEVSFEWQPRVLSC